MTASKQPTDALTERLEGFATYSSNPDVAALARAVIEYREALEQIMRFTTGHAGTVGDPVCKIARSCWQWNAKIDAALSKELGL